MSLSAGEVMTIALARIQRVEPSRAHALSRWFAKNTNRLEPLAGALLRQYERSGSSFTGDSAPAIVDQLLGLLSRRLPEQYEWAKHNEAILRLMVRSAIQGLGDAGPSADTVVRTGLYPLELPTTPAERMATNIAAIRIVSAGRTPTEAERLTLLRYTGNGGLSLEKLAQHVPSEWVPDTKGVVDEFYTLPSVCVATANTVAALVGHAELAGPALEPSAGIGRFIGAFSARPDFGNLKWAAVEYSKLSATICGLLYPFAEVHNQPFEQWVVDHHNEAAGKLALVVTNPPYGKRGANKVIDPDKDYREDTAYPYFLRRPFDMLRPGGIGVALVPNGFLSGKTPQLQRVRERLLLRHHLLCAYRLPSNIYPGADIVTDLSFWRARGGELPSVVPDDQRILDGEYFTDYPQNILGVEKVSQRGRYQVEGTFTNLPYPEPRTECVSCAVTPYLRPMVKQAPPEERLSMDLAAAHLLGVRISRYLSLAGSSREADIAKAASLHGELVGAVEAWLQHMRSQLGEYAPARHAELVREANSVPTLATLLSVTTPDGKLTPAFLKRPEYVSSYVGPATVAAHAEWLYAKTRGLTLADLQVFRREQGFREERDELELELVAQGWCEDWPAEGSQWIPASDYYTGDLWPKLDRARAIGSPRAHTQLARLLELIGVVTLEEAAPTVRDGWIPPDMTGAFLADSLKIEVPELHWFRALLKPVKIEYAELHKLDERIQTFLGYVNHDMLWFNPPYAKQTDPETGEEETAERAKDRARLEYGAKVGEEFQAWLSQDPARVERVLEAYRRTFRGYRAPEYPPAPLPIARWGTQITLKPHQTAGAWRLIRNNGGLLAFDVGVGKTLTGIATLAHLREIGRARRPLVIVPNSIVWKWYREVMRALPDYRVVVIGSTRYLGRENIYRSRLDEPAERLKKWNEFKLGLYDVALCTYSVFARTGVSEEALRQFVEETPPLLREIGLKAAELQTEIDQLSEIYEKRQKTQQRLDSLLAELDGAVADITSDDENESDDE